MFYFSHSTNFNNFLKIIRSSYIYAPYYAPYQLRGLSITTKNSKYIFTNLFVNDLPLKDDDKKGFGEVSIIIDPVILKYKICYFNPGWTGGIDSKTIIMNNNIDFVLDLAKKITDILIYWLMKHCLIKKFLLNLLSELFAVKNINMK